MKKIDYSIGKFAQAILLIISVFIILFVGTRINWIYGIVLGFVPIILFLFLFFISNPYWFYIVIFIFNYYIMGLMRYIPSLKGGIIMDAMLIIIFISLIINGFSRKVPILWNRINTPLTLSALIWLIYCIFEFFNVESVSLEAWFTGVRELALYFLIIVIIVQIICKDYNEMKKIIFIWSILTITALIKVFIQKHYGFDAAEKQWLFVDGGARTHIIFSGIKYFSFFTDAANFGCNMAFSSVTLFISAIGEKKKSIKIYYFIISLLAIYGMLLSGARTSIVIPFIGLAFYVIFSKKIKSIIIFSLILSSMFVFFKFTNIGSGNILIWRMRTAFSPSKDASFIVRKENQAKMRTFMVDKKFGIGIGLGGGKAEKYNPNGDLSQLPTDTWLVMIWVETGIVGLSIYILTLLFIMSYGGYIIFFKLKNKELRHYIIGLYGGIAGMIVASYGNEIFGQFPNGFIIYTGLAFIFISPHFEKELSENEPNVQKLVKGNIIIKDKDIDNNETHKTIN